MEVKDVLGLVWKALNSPAGITFMAGALLWALNKLYAKKPGWQKFEGAIISAVKFAEKEIPDDTPNKGMARLDAALKYVLAVYEKVEGKKASKTVEDEITDGISIVHNRLESEGTL